MKTTVVNNQSIKRKWYLVDANEKVLGRLASKVALVLTGKNKTAYSPNQDHGDYVIVINAEKIRLTLDKAEIKKYFRHSGYPGGQKTRTYKEQMVMNPSKIVEDAIWGMLPKKALGRSIYKKLHVYTGDVHPHTAQQPEALSL